MATKYIWCVGVIKYKVFEKRKFENELFKIKTFSYHHKLTLQLTNLIYANIYNQYNFWWKNVSFGSYSAKKNRKT